MTYQAHFENGVIVLDEPANLPDGAKVRVELLGGGANRTWVSIELSKGQILTNLLIISLLTFSFWNVSGQSATINLSDFVRLTDLGAGVKPEAINSNGQIVGQGSNGQAFSWENGTMTALGTLGGVESFANDVNDNGVVVGWSLDSEGKQKGFKWDGALVNLDSVSTLSSSAEAVNNLGHIVGWKTNGSVFRSSLWSEADPNGFLAFGTGNHKAIGINDHGEVVGVTLDGNNALDEGFFWNGIDPISDISGSLGQDYFPIAGVNNNSATAGFHVTTASIMSIGTSDPSPLGKLLNSDPFSRSLGLNDAGLIVGESGLTAFAFDLSTNTLYNMNDFNRLGFKPESMLRLTDINNDGTFIGIARFNGIDHGVSGNFVVVPEPSTFDIMTLGIPRLVIWLFSSEEEKN